MQQARKKKQTYQKSSYNDSKFSFQPRNNTQRLHYNYMQSSDIVFAVGPEGVGKSYTSMAYAWGKYEENPVSNKINICRSLIGVDGEDIGALKGSLEDKLDPWFGVMYDLLVEVSGSKGKVDTGIRNGNINIKPFIFMRGATLSDCTTIVTEAQNLSWVVMRMILTRQGDYSTFILEGGLGQSDLDEKVTNGLERVLDLLEKYDNDVPVVTYTSADCVRSERVKKWLELFEKGGY